ncbi:hypothetical protein [Psychrobacillus psychrotolerans]|uniref:hypothetical protein n=1 Tax=Psychrobacillus psychrotolerans TaxID=126156 RepID=UPI003314BCF6
MMSKKGLTLILLKLGWRHFGKKLFNQSVQSFSPFYKFLQVQIAIEKTGIPTTIMHIHPPSK